MEVNFSEYLIKGPAAKGKRVSNRIVRKVVETVGKAPVMEKHNLVLPGLKVPEQELPDDNQDDGDQGED